MNTSSFATYWYLHVPSLVLVALIYLLLARGVVALALGWNSSNPLARVLGGITHPVLAVVGALTPRAVPRMGVLIFAIVWLFTVLAFIVYALTILRARPLWM